MNAETTRIDGVGRVIRNQQFTRLWLAQIVSQTAQNAINFALLIEVSRTNSTLAVGFEIISFSLPSVIFGPAAGVFVDRLSKRHVLLISNVLRAVVALALIPLYHSLIFIYLLLFAMSFVGQFFGPAESATIPLLVGRPGLLSAISLFNVTFVMSQAVGYVGGTILYRAIGPGKLFLVVAASYLLASILVYFIKLREPTRARGKPWLGPLLEVLTDGELFVAGRSAFLRAARETMAPISDVFSGIYVEMREGWLIVHDDHIIMLSIGLQAFVSALMLMMAQLAPTYVRQDLHSVAANSVYVLLPAGLGLVLGSGLMGTVVKRVGLRGAVQTGLIGFGGAMICLALLPALLGIGQVGHAESLLQPRAIPLYITILVLGLTLAAVNVPAQTVMQQRTPERVRGRVFSLQQLAANAAPIPVLLFAGALADTFAVWRMMLIVGVAMVAIGVIVVWRRRRALIRNRLGALAVTAGARSGELKTSSPWRHSPMVPASAAISPLVQAPTIATQEANQPVGHSVPYYEPLPLPDEAAQAPEVDQHERTEHEEAPPNTSMTAGEESPRQLDFNESPPSHADIALSPDAGIGASTVRRSVGDQALDVGPIPALPLPIQVESRPPGPTPHRPNRPRVSWQVSPLGEKSGRRKRQANLRSAWRLGEDLPEDSHQPEGPKP